MADAHPRAMAPAQPGRTRTAPPQKPPKFPTQGRYRIYTLFGLTGIVYMVVGFGILDAIWALGNGREAWEATLASYASPVYVAWHALALAAFVFVGVRFLSLFPKAQPPRIGPAKPPPAPILLGMLYGAWIGITVLLAAVLAGGLF